MGQRVQGRGRSLARGVLCIWAVGVGVGFQTVSAQSVDNNYYVLQKYQDAACSNMHQGQGTQQSWLRLPGQQTNCYHILSGFACDHQCYIRMTCEYGSGSGVVLEHLIDDTCQGQVTSKNNLAAHWTWLQAKSFFEGGCVQYDASTWLRFSRPLAVSAYPDCQSEGAVADDEQVNAFQAEYIMQFYNDTGCTHIYTPGAYSTQTSSRFNLRVHRESQYCYDWVDETPSTGAGSRWVPQSILNFKFLCGNTDMAGNGVRVTRYSARVCTGRAEATQNWRDVFYPMNFPELNRFFQGQCVRWGVHYVKFDRAVDKAHYPDCSDHACTSGYCAGGRIVTNAWTHYTGPISTLPSSTSAAREGAGLAALTHLWLCLCLVSASLHLWAAQAC